MQQGTKAENYQVFINHKGDDTKRNIASLIYHKLKSYGLQVFWDKEELHTGNTICPALQEAIGSSSVRIAIFSKNYAHSTWCLAELCWMLKPSQDSSVIPVFYDVEPADLRHIERGPYAQAFSKHRQRVPMEVVNEWREALKAAASISGLPFKTNESDYGEFLEKIGNIVIKLVRWDTLEVAAHPVGLEQTLKDLDDHIQKQRSTKVIVLAGLGGIGKSTLAKYIFNLRRSEFNRASYLCNVRETVDLTSLQRQLLSDLRGLNRDIHNTFIGKTILRNSLKGLKILIVLDDVDDREKIKSVVDLDAVEPCSLILITSRYRDIVGGSSASTFLYDVKPLKRNHARELFCHHAFRQLNPPEKYEDLVEDFLKMCGGLPLSLEVFGEQLAGKLDRTYWKRQLELYFKGQPLIEADTVINALKWSYQAMEIEQQEMLLDVGCFFVGEDLELAVRVLEGLSYNNDVRNTLESLRRKCRIDFNNNVEYQIPGVSVWSDSISWAVKVESSKIIMQHQVTELARRIVGDKQLRLSCSIDIEKMLQLQSGSVLCRGICFRKDWSQPKLPEHISIWGVRVLVVEHTLHSSWFLGSRISGDLVWLRWRISPFISLPRTILLRKLRVLELQAPNRRLLQKFFDSIDKIPLRLREVNIDVTEQSASSSTSSRAQPIDLQHSSKSFDGNISTTRQSVMPFFSRFLRSIGSLIKNLNKVVLKNVIISQSPPFDFSALKNLRHLDLSGSTNLTTLPNSFSQLLQLQHLTLRDCRNLSIPVGILGEISTLEHIDFKCCVQLVHFPQGIASQRRLRYLNLLETSLLELPLTLEPPYELEQLIIGSQRFTELPYSVAWFVHLKELILVQCFNLEHISTPIEQLTCLERLEIYGSNVPILPAGIALLKHLKVLNIYSSPIEKFTLDNNVFDALTDLTLCGTYISGITIPAGACPMLEIVDLSYNCHLNQVEVSQSSLVKLNLDGCENLQYMNLPKLGRLKFLDIKRCGYVAIQNVAECRSLEEITAEECRFTIEAGWNQLERPAWCQLERLNFFTFSQDIDNFSMRWPKYSESRNRLMAALEFEKLLNSFDDVTLLKIPPTATHASPLLLRNVHSHTAILMCFLTTNKGSFQIRFEACKSGAQSEVLETRQYGSRAQVHMYVWTQRSRLFTDVDHFYDNVSIYKKGGFNMQGGEKGWILTFSSENRVLDVCNQIINHSAEVEQGLDWLFSD